MAPAGVIYFLIAAPADVPTPPAGYIAYFANSSDGNKPYWKDSAGAVHSLAGGVGAAGPQGLMGPPGFELGYDDREIPLLSSSVAATVVPGGSGISDHAYFGRLAASLEPEAIEVLKINAFSYVIGAAETKIIQSSWQARIGSGGAGRFERRDVFGLLALRDITITGLANGSVLSAINPALPVYTNALQTYYDRLQEMSTIKVRTFDLTAPNTFYPLLPGPYGSIILHTTTFDLTWIAVVENVTYIGGNICLPITNEIGDAGATEYQRVTSSAPFAISRNNCIGILTGQEKSAGVGKGSVAYIHCPSTWSKVPDTKTYHFRDDFLGAAIDTATKWTRAQSTAGNVEIDTNNNWLGMRGNGVWGANGLFSQTTRARTNGDVYEILVFTHNGVGQVSPFHPNLIVGCHDGAGQSFSDFSHAVYFSTGGVNRDLFVFENGVSRGVVGTGYELNTMYLIRITINGNAAVYEIQGGDDYALIGGTSWTNITPGTTSSSTTPLAIGAAQEAGSRTYLSFPKIYTP